MGRNWKSKPLTVAEEGVNVMLHCTTNAFNVAKKDIGLETVRTVATTRGIREENDQAPIPGTKHFFILIYNYIYLF